MQQPAAAVANVAERAAATTVAVAAVVDAVVHGNYLCFESCQMQPEGRQAP